MILTFLGTGAGIPSRFRNVSSLAICFPNKRNETWLFDCGEGTQHQILQTKLSPVKIRNIFISHLHGDHLYGLPGIIGTRSALGAKSQLTIYGPTGLQTFIETALKTSQIQLTYPLEIIEIEDGMSLTINQFQLQIRLLKHRIPSYGFRLTCPDRPGKLDHQRLIELGIPPGPIYGELKKGKTIQLEDGRVINGKEFVSPPIPGHVVVYLGDTMPCPNAVQLAHHADLLIHEATFSHSFAEKAVIHQHSTTIEAAKVAAQAEVQTLILTHFSNRYHEKDLQELLQEAQSIFPQTLVAKDLWTFELH